MEELYMSDAKRLADFVIASGAEITSAPFELLCFLRSKKFKLRCDVSRRVWKSSTAQPDVAYLSASISLTGLSGELFFFDIPAYCTGRVDCSGACTELWCRFAADEVFGFTYLTWMEAVISGERIVLRGEPIHLSERAVNSMAIEEEEEGGISAFGLSCQ